MKKLFLTLLFTLSICCCVMVNASAEEWLWPVPGNLHIYQPFKSTHSGLDISQNAYHIVYATKSGTVITSKPYVCTHWSKTSSGDHSSSCAWSSSNSLLTLGNYIEIDHGDGTISRYGHLCYGFNNSASGVTIPVVNVGDYVSQGTPIGIVGSSGNSGGQHLHFTIKKNGSNFNTNPANNSLITSNNSKYSNSDICNGGTINYVNTSSLYKKPGQTPSTPSAPTITSVSTVSSSSLTVKWNAVSGATAYRIDRRRSGDEAYSTIVSSTTSTSYTDTGLLAGEKYYYRVYALNGSVTSDRSESIGAYTQCDIPEITSAVGDSTSSITIKWNYVNGASYYRIDRRKSGDEAYSTIVANHTGSRTYTDTGLAAGEKYYYRVYAVNDSSVSERPGGYGGYTQCEIPTITSVVANSPSSITIKWNGVSGAASYRIDRRKQADDAYTTIVTGYTSKSYTDTGLEAGTKYYYRVYAVTEGSVSAKPDGEGTFTKYIYTIKYNANGGSGAPGSQSKIQDTALTLSSTKPTRTGYSFVNWNTKADGSGTAYKAGGSYTANSNVTLYAYWKPWTYTIAFNLNGGEGNISSQTKTQDVNLTLSTSKPTRTGYSFVNWNTKADGSGTTYKAGGLYTANSGTTLYAQWKANTYKVTFNANGGTTPIDSKNVTYESTYEGLPKPTRAGYTFEGWYTSASGGAAITANSKVLTASAHSLYAQWTENIFDEEFSCVGEMTYNGHCYQLFNEVVSWEYAKEYCERIGGHLVTISDENENLMLVSLMKNHLSDKVTHYWIGATCYDNSENMQWVTEEPFEYINWNKNEPDNAGQYWMNITAQTGKWNDFLNKYATMGFICEFESFSDILNIKVTFNANGGTTSTASKDVTYNSTYGELPTPTKDGYIFNGWYTSVEGGTQITSDTKVSITSTQTLYAHWEIAIPYTESTVTKSGLKLIIDTKVYNITAPYDILIVGYKRNQFVTMKRVPHDEQNSPYTLEGDIDEIKVMVWEDLSTIRPLCEAEVIPNSKFIVE